MNIPGILKNMANSFGSNSMRELLEDMAQKREVHAPEKEQAGASFNLSAYRVEELFDTPRARKEQELNSTYTKRARTDKETPSEAQRNAPAAEAEKAEHAHVVEQRSLKDVRTANDNQAQSEQGKDVFARLREKDFPYRAGLAAEKMLSAEASEADGKTGLGRTSSEKSRAEPEPVDISV